MANPVLDFYVLAGAFLLASFIFTLILKRFTKAQTYFVLSMIKTQKPIWVFDRLSVLGKPLDWLTEAGIVLGFGAIGFDYLYAKKFSKAKRIGIFLIATIIFSVIFILFDQLIGKSFSAGFFTKEFFYPMVLLFGITGFSGFLIAVLAVQAASIVYNFFTGQGSCPGVAPVLPGIDVPNVPISIPLFAWIPLLLVVIIHELMHGVVARKEKIPIKSTGILLLGFLPIGGFVEPDEKALLSSTEKTQLHVFAAGVITNIIAFLGTMGAMIVLLLVLSATVSPWALNIRNQGIQQVQIESVKETIEFCKNEYPSPAFGALKTGMVLKEINQKQISHSSDVTLEITKNRFLPITLLVVQDGTQKEITLKPNELGSFGFVLEDIPVQGYSPPQEFVYYSVIVGLLFGIANWFLLFNLLVGMMNYLPFPILDGGRIAPIILAPYLGFLGKNKEDTQKLITKFFTYLILALFAINALPLFF